MTLSHSYLFDFRLANTRWHRLHVGIPAQVRFGDRHDAYMHIMIDSAAPIQILCGRRVVAIGPGAVAIVFNAEHSLQLGEGEAVGPIVEIKGQEDFAERILAPENTHRRCHLISGALTLSESCRLRFQHLLPRNTSNNGSILLTTLAEAGIAANFEMLASGAGGNAYLSRVAELLLLQAVRGHFGVEEIQRRLDRTGPVSPQMIEAVRLIHQRPADPWSVKSLASALGMSRSSFSAQFLAAVGETPMAYVSRIRLERAAELVSATDQPVTQVAQLVGFRSATHFINLFRTRYGMSPKRYRSKQANAAIAGSG